MQRTPIIDIQPVRHDSPQLILLFSSTTLPPRRITPLLSSLRPTALRFPPPLSNIFQINFPSHQTLCLSNPTSPFSPFISPRRSARPPKCAKALPRPPSRSPELPSDLLSSLVLSTTYDDLGNELSSSNAISVPCSSSIK